MKKIDNKNIKLFKVLAKLLNVSESKININTSENSLSEYDSLAILNIATFFERKIKNKKINLDIKDFSSVKKINQFIRKNNIQI